ncbi:excinuclease ABC subunit UvrA [Bacteriovoracales bacterium]|nr:excinuclease ABC subunit UvrA [Bacteriovoracales bacterium]
MKEKMGLKSKVDSKTDNFESKVKELNHIVVLGAKEHNLKNVDIKIPKKKLVIITGVSGSGKSSLAFDTIYAEGQRRYVESLSSYARQFLGQMEKPKFDSIRGLSPTIAIEQKAASKNPRSTVGTITEVYDYLRVLFARVGTQFCHQCGKEVGRGDATGMVNQITKIPEATKILILAPVIENRKGEHRDILDNLKREGFVRVRIDGIVRDIDDVQTLAKNKKHNIEVVVDRLKIKSGSSFKKRLTDSVELSLKLGKGQIIVHVEGREDLKMSEERSCCGHAFPELIPQLFSFNSPTGMCGECHGLGSVINIDIEKVIPDENQSICEGAVRPWENYFETDGSKRELSWGLVRIEAMEEAWGLDLTTPWNKLPKKIKERIINGCDDPRYQLTMQWAGDSGEGQWNSDYEGLIPRLMRLYLKHKNDGRRSWISKYISTMNCQSCEGKRLKNEVQNILIKQKSISDVTALSIQEALGFFQDLKFKGNQRLIGEEVLKEIKDRLSFLVNVGLNYLSLDRHGPTLSGGEAQRIRLASQIGSELTGVLYILDEPSIGLHQRDNIKLINTLKRLRDIGNSLIVVEHDQETMESSDWIIDMGPEAGNLGGQIIAEGTPAQIKRSKVSMTGRYLSGKESIPIPEEVRKPDERWLKIIGANENNLKNIDAEIPVGLFTCVTGVSGAGKSTLINQILYPALSRTLHDSDIEVGKYKKIEGLDNIDKVINIDQKPIGKTPRSNPATYTKLFDHVRDLFEMIPEAKARGYKKGRFSFNVKGGRCEKCEGDGYITVEMHFLADVLVPCEVCKTRRFNEATLEVKFKGHSIADVLELSVSEAMELFTNQPKIKKILTTLMDVGLGYIKLGQPATTLSGGEAQRIKLAKELSKRDTGKTLYILDEPTTGLHFQDIQKLLSVLQRLVDGGNTMIVIEHNLDVIKCADWCIEMGPEGGYKGGVIVAQGAPNKITKSKKGPTGLFLKEIFKNR